MDVNIAFATTNIDDPKERLRRIIGLITKKGKEYELNLTTVDETISVLNQIKQKYSKNIGKININKNISHRIETNYFYPIKKKKIITKSINEVLNKHTKSKNIPIFVKIDILFVLLCTEFICCLSIIFKKLNHSIKTI
jgi:hypothetical protein